VKRMTNYLYRFMFAGICLVGMSSNTFAWTSKDGSWVANGYLENSTHQRPGVGISRQRSRGQLEWSKTIGSVGIFRNVSMSGTLRGSYDAAYDINDDDYGNSAGGPLTFSAPANPVFLGSLPGTGAPAFLPFSTTPTFGAGAYLGAPLPPGVVDSATGAIGLFPLGLNGLPGPNLSNDGLVFLGSDLRSITDSGVQLGVPVRPCDKDSRGCIDGYMDADKQELTSPEFNDRADVIREAYLDATLPLSNGDELSFRVGRQQVVWGRTDLFRVLDVINPVDFSQQNIYEELEDARIPMGIFNMEYHAGGGKIFEDLNFQFLWKFEKFRPHNLGQGGQPYQILGAGGFFRSMKNCWDNGCAVGNFPAPGVAVAFGPNQIGIRQANVPDWAIDETDVGVRMEGVYKGVGFSANALYYNSQLPSLRGGLTAIDPFTGAPGVFPYSLAFDIDFPRILLLGGSADFYVEKIKSAFRVELAWTTGEEFANTLRPRLFSESNVMRYVVGWDRPTFIPFLNKNRAILFSAQLFGQHLLDHELERGLFGPVGIPDWKDNWVGTLLIQGFYKNDTVLPRVITAYDVRAQAAAIAPQVDWLIDNNWRLTVGANFKLGTGARPFDDDRTAIPYPGLSGALGGAPIGGSVGLGGFEPLGRFRSGPIGMAQREDEVQVTLRYRF
jgi:uncharacterized protein DUF1302